MRNVSEFQLVSFEERISETTQLETRLPVCEQDLERYKALLMIPSQYVLLSQYQAAR